MFEETISQRQEDKVVVTRKDIKQIIRSAQKLHRPPTMGEVRGGEVKWWGGGEVR